MQEGRGVVVAFTEVEERSGAGRELREHDVTLAAQQASVRRVATLVAHESPPDEIFGAVTEEAARVLDTEAVGMLRFEPDGSATLVAQSPTPWTPPPLGTHFTVDGDNVVTRVLRTGQSARLDDWTNATGSVAAMAHRLGVGSSVATPIIVEGRIWGTLIAATSRSEPLPADAASRIGEFTELVATAISNAQARAEVHDLANEQAALRRVATLVAQERPPADVFTAVAEEVARVLRIEATMIYRYDADRTITVVAGCGDPDFLMPLGTRLPLGGANIATRVFQTERPSRMDDYTTATGPIGARARELAVRSGVGCPILVDGRLWGAMIAMSGQAAPLPADTEFRVGNFTELVATAISNVQARADLAASRARIVAAADEERRRVVRDLHDGAQQRLVHTTIMLKLAHRALEEGHEAAAHVAEALDQAKRATDELRELAHGIMPAELAGGGLRAGVESLASRVPVPVTVDVSVDRLPAPVEATGYFVVAEALTNVAKHSCAGSAAVTADVENGTLRVRVRDDGVGGARPDGSGLVGLGDRLAAIDGRLSIESPDGGGTLVAADIPV
jgi:signal transduction histidine kinase